MDQLDQEVLKGLVYQGHETANLDYKGDMPWEKPSRYGLIKDIIAFANRGGGWIVVGVDEDGKTPEEQRTGVGEANLATWEVTKVSTGVNNFAGPPIDIMLRRWYDSEEEKWYVIVHVPQHRETPHLCIDEQKDHKGNHVLRKAALYYRTDNKESAEISDPVRYAKLIRQCLLHDRENLLREFQQIMEGVRGEGAILREFQQVLESVQGANTGGQTRSVPINMVALADRYKEHTLKFNPPAKDRVYQEVLAVPSNKPMTVTPADAERALSNACVDYHGWPYVFFLPRARFHHSPEHDDDKIYAIVDQLFGTRKTFHYWAFRYDGGFYSRNETVASSVGQHHIFDPLMQARFIGEAAIALGRLYDSLSIPLDQEITLFLRYGNLDDYTVGSIDQTVHRIHEPVSFGGSILTTQTKHRLHDLLNKPGKIAASLVSSLTDKMGYQGRLLEGAVQEYVEKGLQGGQRLVDLNWQPADDS